jgi:hypothetical protein
MEEKKSNQKNLGIMIVAAVIIAAGSFYGGMVYAGANIKAANSLRGGAGFPGRGTSSGNRGAGFVTGAIIKSDATTITVQGRDGSSKIIYMSNATTVGKTVAGSKADLAVGDNVMVNGKANADGSVVADNVAIRPIDAPGSPNAVGGNPNGQNTPGTPNVPVVK